MVILINQIMLKMFHVAYYYNLKKSNSKNYNNNLQWNHKTELLVQVWVSYPSTAVKAEVSKVYLL